MNQEKQRIAIAEACGKWPSGWPHDYMNQADRLRHIPDYLNDLNAMHEAEKVLTLPERRKYRKTLLGHCEPASIAIHADAAQRAEAFLRTIGKWTID